MLAFSNDLSGVNYFGFNHHLVVGAAHWQQKDQNGHGLALNMQPPVYRDAEDDDHKANPEDSFGGSVDVTGGSSDGGELASRVRFGLFGCNERPNNEMMIKPK